MEAIKKANKKAYTEIRQIQNSSSMMDVNSLISTAMVKTFGLWNIGLLKIRMNNNEQFDVLKSRRLANMNKYGKDVKSYLITFIPDKLKNCIMYNELISKP